MIFRNRIIRVLVIGSALLFAQIVPAFAEKTTLACSLGSGYVTLFYTFDLDAKTVKDAEGGTFAIRITDDEIYWKRSGPAGTWQNVVHIYNRRTAQLVVYYPNGASTTTCQRAPSGPL